MTWKWIWGIKMKRFYHIINEIENNNNEITVSEYFHRCIAQAINENEKELVDWFCKIKNDVEGELVAWAKEHGQKYISERNRVERKTWGIQVLLGKKIKFKDTVLNIYFPDEFHQNSVIVERGF